MLIFKGASVGDVSALAENKALEELTLPVDATNVEALRELPNLKLINDRPAAEFWKKFDAEKAGK